MNAATSIITTKSPYMVRTSFTVPQVNEALGAWAYKNGVRKAYTLVSDFGPGHDGEAAFTSGFKDAGGEIIGSARYPVANLDFTAFVQRAKDCQPGRHLHLGARRPAAGGDRQGDRRARHRQEQDQDHGPGRADLRGRAQEHGRRRRSA